MRCLMQTKFLIILSSDRGTKQAGEICFDVAQYINEKQLNKKNYKLHLENCPDKNSKLYFTFSGVLLEEINEDTISKKSYAEPMFSEIKKESTKSIIMPK